MSRPGTNVDKKLLQAGIKLIALSGLRTLTVRAVCAKAGVNLGMFSYLYQNKENYLKALFAEIRCRLDVFLDMEQAGSLNALERLKYFVRRMALFAKENTNLLRALLVDCAADENIGKKYHEKGIVDPFILPFQLVSAAQKEGFLRTDFPDFEINRILFFGITMPILFPGFPSVLTGVTLPAAGNKDFHDKYIDELFKLVEKKENE